MAIGMRRVDEGVDAGGVRLWTESCSREEEMQEAGV